MAKICPNCFRPVRTGAKYCGYCGFVLDPAAVTDSSVGSISPQQEGQEQAGAGRPKPSRSKAKRTIMYLLIAALIIVLVIAFLANNPGLFFPGVG